MTRQEHIAAAEAAAAQESEIPLDTGSRHMTADRLLRRAQVHATLAAALTDPAPAPAAVTPGTAIKPTQA
jgi:hypothetical protein